MDQIVGSGAHLAFADSVAARSITLVSDKEGLIPINSDGPGVTLHIGYAPSTWLWANRYFHEGLLARMPHLTQVLLDERSSAASYVAAENILSDADQVIVSVYVPPSVGSGPEALPETFRDLVEGSTAQRPTILVSFASPYLIRALPSVGSYVVAWGDREVSQRAAVKALFGEEEISGRMPIPLPPVHRIGAGLDRPKVTTRVVTRTIEDPLVAAGIVQRGQGSGRFGQEQTLVDPSTVGMSADGLAKVDSIIKVALADSAASGASLAIGRHGR